MLIHSLFFTILCYSNKIPLSTAEFLRSTAVLKSLVQGELLCIKCKRNLTAVLTQAQWKNLCSEEYSLEGLRIFEEARLQRSELLLNVSITKHYLQMGASLVVTYETFSHSLAAAS